MYLNLCSSDPFIQCPRQKRVVDAFRKYSKKIELSGKVQHENDAIKMKVYNMKKSQYEKVNP